MRDRIRQSVRRLSGYVPGEQPRRRGIIKLNTNENPYPPSPLVNEALRTLRADTLRSYPDPMHGALRERIAALHGASPSQVFVGNGSDEVLALCTRAFVESDGAIGYFEPSYSLYPVLADIREVCRAPVALGPDFEWQMPPADGAALFFLANPNAPTSLLFAHSDVAAFCDTCSGVVVIDEAYVDFSRADCMDLALSRGNVLVARTLSKAYSLAGLRLGYAVGAAELIDALYKLKDSYNVNRVTQELGLAALNDVAHMRANVARVIATRKRIMDTLEQLGFRVWRSETNFIWTEPKVVLAQELFDALKARDILVRYFPGDRTGACVRITVGTDAESDALLQAVKDIVS
jgi:histidinol-phosphate aminotransferase